MSILRGALAFSTATLISRILGLFRDAVLAYKFGASAELDAYMVAILFPFFLRKVFAEGAMVSAFLPVYGSVEDKDDFVSSILNSLGIVALSISIFFFLKPEYAVRILAMGNSKDFFELSSELLRITIFFVPVVFIWAVFYSVLNYRGNFFLPALSPAFINVGVIIGATVDGIKGCAIGFLSGSIFSAAILGAISKVRYRPILRCEGEFYKLFFKSILALSVSQLNLLVDTNVASFSEEGSISVIQLSTRLYNLPLGLFGVAVSTVALSQLVSTKGNISKLREAVERALFLSIPSAFGMAILSKGLVELIYGKGNFSGADVIRTAAVLSFYSIGIPAYSLIQTLMRYHHSLKDMETPMKAMWIISILNASLDVLLFKFIGIYGIPLATSISGYVGALYLVRGKKEALSMEVLKVTFSSVTMAIVLILLPKNAFWAIPDVVVGVLVYAVACHVLRCESFKEFVGIIRRPR